MKPRDNPFRTSRTDALSFRDFSGTDIPDLLRRVRTSGGRGAIIGPMGTGKSTLLRELAAALAQEGRNVVRLQMTRETPCLSPDDRLLLRRLTMNHTVCIDGADLLPRRVWWFTRHACRRASFLLVTSHARPMLPVLYRTNPTPALLLELTRELLAGAPPLTEPEGRDLFNTSQGNIREALRALYDRFALTG